MTEPELNSLYNHPKVKVPISFTKGEGFGRPLLEACVASGKPIMASGWSGHLDFLNKDESILLNGTLEEIHQSAVWEGVINKGTKWFQVDYNNAANIMHHVWKQYNIFRRRGVKLAKTNEELFSFNTIQERTAYLMDKYLPEFTVPEEVTMSLPNLPKLKKITKKSNKKEVPIEKKGLKMLTGVGGEVNPGAKASRGAEQAPDGEIINA